MATLGNTVDGSDTSPGSGDRLFLYRVTAVEDGTITDAYCRFDVTGTAGGNAKVVLYNSAAGHAGTLVAASSALSVPATNTSTSVRLGSRTAAAGRGRPGL